VLQFATRAEPWRRLKLFNTGVDNNGVVLPGYAVDPHFSAPTSTFPAAPGPNAYVIPLNEQPPGCGWVCPNGISEWISPLVNANVSGPDGFVTYRTHFDMTGIPTNGARIQGRWTVDNSASIYLNGVYTGNALNNPSYSSFHPFTITNGFRRGLNTLEFVTTNIFGFNGLRVEFNQMPTNVVPGFISPLNVASGRVRLVGAYTNVFTALSDFWRMESVTFVARSSTTVLQFDGLSSGVWLDHIQMRDTGRKYYQPEEPMSPLLGERSFGLWNLEVWDSRLGAIAGGADLISWRLNLTYVRTNPPFAALSNGVPFIGRVYSNNLAYFTVDVPCDAGLVTNTLMSLTPPGTVDLLFNQSTFPTGSEPGDIVLTANTLSNAVVLDIGTYPLLRPGRYFLAVRNTDPTQDNSYYLRVDLACEAKFAFTAITIPTKASFTASGFLLTWIGPAGAEFRVEYAEDPVGPWTPFPGTVSSTNSEFSFTDDDSVGGGISPVRYYRIVQIE
jgi:hypothetical protein